MKNSNVIIISENRKKAEKFISKVILLRSFDSISIVDKKNFEDIFKNKFLDLILVHIENREDAYIIKKLKSKNILQNVSIIALTENEDCDILCQVFDFGADDFMNIHTEDTQVIMRVMWGLQKKLLLDSSTKKSEIMSDMNIIDRITGFYTKAYSHKIFEEEYTKHSKSNNNAIFMMIAADLKCKSKITLNCLADAIKKVIRNKDMVGFAPDERFYIFLYQTSEIGAKSIFDRINNILPEGITISASAINFSEKNFNETEHLINKQLGQALTKHNEFIYSNGKTIIPYFGKPAISVISNENQKNIRNIFLAKTEKIITPLFFKMQAIYEPKLFNTKIFQEINKTESIFIVNSKIFSSEIKIKYENYKNITIEITEICPKEKNIQKFDFKPGELSPEKLEEIMQDILEKFKSNLYDSEEEVL